jgi:hypothetical protein
MQAYVRKLYRGNYYIVEGNPDDPNNFKVIDRPYGTRRQALRYAKKDGYDIVIRNRPAVKKRVDETDRPIQSGITNNKPVKPANYGRKSIFERLETGKQMVAENKAAMKDSKQQKQRVSANSL